MAWHDKQQRGAKRIQRELKHEEAQQRNANTAPENRKNARPYNQVSTGPRYDQVEFRRNPTYIAPE